MAKEKEQKASLKDSELVLISELMKNSRRSDRELARAIGISQPTVSKMIRKLKQEGYIKEFTMIPDFYKLGYEIMGVTMVGFQEFSKSRDFEKIRRKTIETERNHPHASVMAVNGLDGDKNRLFVTFYENYAAFREAMALTKKLPHVNVKNIESFLVSLKDNTNYRILSMSLVAEHILKKKKEKNPEISKEKNNPKKTSD